MTAEWLRQTPEKLRPECLYTGEDFGFGTEHPGAVLRLESLVPGEWLYFCQPCLDLIASFPLEADAPFLMGEPTTFPRGGSDPTADSPGPAVDTPGADPPRLPLWQRVRSWWFGWN